MEGDQGSEAEPAKSSEGWFAFFVIACPPQSGLEAKSFWAGEDCQCDLIAFPDPEKPITTPSVFPAPGSPPLQTPNPWSQPLHNRLDGAMGAARASLNAARTSLALATGQTAANLAAGPMSGYSGRASIRQLFTEDMEDDAATKEGEPPKKYSDMNASEKRINNILMSSVIFACVVLPAPISAVLTGLPMYYKNFFDLDSWFAGIMMAMGHLGGLVCLLFMAQKWVFDHWLTAPFAKPMNVLVSGFSSVICCFMLFAAGLLADGSRFILFFFLIYKRCIRIIQNEFALRSKNLLSFHFLITGAASPMMLLPMAVAGDFGVEVFNLLSFSFMRECIVAFCPVDVFRVWAGLSYVGRQGGNYLPHLF